MNILNGTDSLLYNLNRNQQNLGKSVSRLSSGLRIESAADDPSGLAISESLRSRVGGLQQAVENVQTGNHLLTVADGAAASITKILQRINSLIVESNSDINSDEQLLNIQTEISALLHEVNTISSNANFNGLKLFDGSHDTYVAPQNANVSIVTVNPGLLPNGTIPTGTQVSNPQGSSATLITPPNGGLSGLESNTAPFVTGLFILQVTAAGNNLVDPLFGVIPGPGVVLNQIIYSPQAGFANGNGNETIYYNVIPDNIGPNNGNGPGFPVNEPFPGMLQSLNFDLANLTVNDVGVAQAVEIVGPKVSGGGTAIHINDNGNEGGNIAISLPTLSTNALQISDISILRPTQVDGPFNTGSPTGVDSSNQYAAMDAQIRVGNAIDAVNGFRAQLGAQMVSTSEDSNNDSINITGLTASESSIRDLNVGSAVTEFTREQILTSVGTSVLSQYEVDARQLTGLLIQALVA